MTDRYKGFLITLDKEIREDDAEHIITTLKMIKGVFSVEPYIKGMEDYMSESFAIKKTYMEIFDFLHENLDKLRKGAD